MTDEAWLSELFQRDYALLYRVGRAFAGGRETLIEDQIQETFLTAWRKRTALRRHPNPDGWMVECFRKHLMNACRKLGREARRTAFSLDAAAEPQLPDSARLSPDDYARSREQLALLRRLLGEKDAELFLRFCVYGEKAAALAPEYGVSEAALRMRVSRLKKKILAHGELFACAAALLLWTAR